MMMMRVPTVEETGWDWVADLRGLQQEMGRLFERFSGEGLHGGTYPPVNVYANEDEAVVTAELPGIAIGDLDISVLRDQLTIRGERKRAELPEGATCHRTERPCGPFMRAVQLPFEIEDGKVQATYQQGVLRLVLPRAEATRPRKIEIATDSE